MPFVRANGKKFLPSKPGQPLREYNPASLPPPAPVSSGSSSGNVAGRSSRPRSVASRSRPRSVSSLLPHVLDDLLSPGPTAAELAETADRLGVKAQPKSDLLAEAAALARQASNRSDSVVQELSHSAEAAKHEVQRAVSTTQGRVDSFLGQPTLGTPTIGQILKAIKRTPVFTSEGPRLYKAAYQHNEQFAKPGPYQTKLSPKEEQQFRGWVAKHGVPFNPDAKRADYDMRGYWKATAGRGWGKGQHFPDTFKTPFDTTFSRESKYATKDNPFVWRGENLVDRRNGRLVFGQNRGVRTNSRGKLTIPATRQAARRLATLRQKKAQIAGPLPGLDSEAQKNARIYLRTGQRAGATRKEQLAALETGIVESGFHNLQYGDADSQGVRQERVSQYGDGPTGANNVRAGAQRFFQESVSDTGGSRGAGQTPGQLAQTIQGSAFPERYDEHAAEAQQILAAFNRGGQAGPKLKNELRVAEAQARELGIPIDQAAKLGPPPKQVVTRFHAGVLAAAELDKAKLPYVWGGGHVTGRVAPTGGGLDCSGAVSYVLQHMGVKLPGGVTSGEMGNYLEPGPGAVTVFYNGEHTFMKIGKRYFGTSHANPGGGAGFIPTSYEQGGAESGKYNVAHVPGLGGKVALQLGIPLTSGGAAGGAFPGMAISSDGTTAQITGGQKKDVTGFSSSPIIYSSAQGASAALPSVATAGASAIGAEGEEVQPGQLNIINDILSRRRS